VPAKEFDGAPVSKLLAPHFESPASGNDPRHAIAMCVALRRASAAPGPCRLDAFMNHDPLCALSQGLEAQQTLLDQLRALAAEDPDFFIDLIEGETNLLELIAALDASIVDDETLAEAPKPPRTNSRPANAPPNTASSSSAGSSRTPCSNSASRPCARRPRRSPSRTRASRRSPSPRRYPGALVETAAAETQSGRAHQGDPRPRESAQGGRGHSGPGGTRQGVG
jgi:hypothetical protein